MIDVPDAPLREHDPEVAEKAEKMNELAAERDDVEEAIRTVRERRADGPADRVDAAADALLAGEEGGTATATGPSVEEELDQLHERLRVLDRAQEKAKDQLREAEKREAREIAEEIEPEYRELVQKIADTLHHLATLVDRERQVRNRLERHVPGSSPHLRVLPALSPGNVWRQLRLELPGGEDGLASVALDNIVSDYDLDDPRGT